MQSNALSPRAVILMTKIKRELVLSGIDAETIERVGWDWPSFEQFCAQMELGSVQSELEKLSEEMGKRSASNQWGI